MARPKPVLRLTGEKRMSLERMQSDPGVSPNLALRAKIVLACSDGVENRTVAQNLSVAEHTVGKWRARFIAGRLNGLSDQPRKGRPRCISRQTLAKIIDTTIHSKADGGKRWSSRTLAQELGVTPNAIRRAWKLMGVQPARPDMFVLDQDRSYSQRVTALGGVLVTESESILALALRPSTSRETAPQSKAATAVQLPIAAKFDGDLAHLAPFLCDDVSGLGVDAFLTKLAREVPRGQEIHLIVSGIGGSSIEPTPVQLFSNRRFDIHFMPTRGAWVNATAYFAELLRQSQRSSEGHANAKRSGGQASSARGSDLQDLDTLPWNRAVGESRQVRLDLSSGQTG